MEKVELTVFDLYLLRNSLAGFGEPFNIKGFINESGLTEGIKRRANKALRIILAELEPINQRLDTIRTEKGPDSKEEKECLSDSVSIMIEKLDFKIIENVSLSTNYQILYDKIFINAEL